MYKFKSRAAGDLLMTQAVGDHVLGLIGKPPAAQGIIEVAQLADAIRALEAAVAAERVAAEDEPPAEAASRPEGAGVGDGILLRQRAWPLVEMMKRALAGEQAIVWGV